MCLRRAALLIVPAVLLAASPALANRGRRTHGPRLQSSGQVVTHGGTSPSANLARARAHQVRQERHARQQQEGHARQEQPRARQQQERRARQQRQVRQRAAGRGPAADSQRAPALSGRDLLRQEIQRARGGGRDDGLDRRSLIALTVSVPAIAGWIYAVSQWGDAILGLLR
ncbi:MAG TPA: hypothetical protein VKZ63_07465 [Kofleriaceae bacterium]|nr:hypothetical protein [Kofleriaceae bacterium]